jgi:sn-glycerol 3-phosphate transport system permease protein
MPATRRGRPGLARRRLRAAVTYAWLTACVVTVCFPLYYVFEGALTPTAWLQRGLPGLVPTHLSLSNIRHATELVPLGRQFINSALVTLAQTTGQVVTAIMAAYALVFGRLRGVRAIFLVFLSTLMIPGETTILANYLTVAHWHLINSLTAVFLPYLASAFSIFQFRQAFLSFPPELRDAAVLEGAGHIRFVGSILLPVTRPTLISATLISAIAAWNGFFWPLLVTNTPDKRTVQIGLSQLSSAEAADVGAILAGTALVTLPILLVVLLGQRFLASGLTAGALK